MTSFFGFGSSGSGSSTVSDDLHLEVTVIPSASAFYAGEVFSATIKFRNTRSASGYPGASFTDAERSTSQASGDERLIRQGHIGRQFPPRDYNAEAGPSRSPSSTPRPGSPRTSPRAERQLRRSSSGSSHSPTRRALVDNSDLSAKEDRPNGPPPLPSRRELSRGQIPRSHPHARKVSTASAIMSPPPVKSPTLPPNLPSIPEASSSWGPSSASMLRDDSLNLSSSSSMGLASGSFPSVVDLTEDMDSHESTSAARSTQEPSMRRQRPVLRSPTYTDSLGSSMSRLSIDSVDRPPPSHPYTRGRAAQEPRGTTTILWAYTHLVAHFHPSNVYIPPDPLLPLRAMLLHQPVGSGSLAPAGMAEPGSAGTTSPTGGLSPSPSRWQMSFGTGTIGGGTTPSFTGSLFGLARDLVYGGQGGTLEEERKRVWNMKDLPVLETGRSLIGVDISLSEGEEKEFEYTMKLPDILPPAHRGKAFRFSYDLVISLTVALPGPGRRQRAKDIHIPIRVWANVTVSGSIRSYDVLSPIIQNTEGGRVETRRPEKAEIESKKDAKPSDTQQSFREYAVHLLGNLEQLSTSPNGTAGRTVPDSPTKLSARMDGDTSNSDPGGEHPRLSSIAVGGQSAKQKIPLQNGLLSVSTQGRPNGQAVRGRKGSFLKGDDELVETVKDHGGPREAVEILSRNVSKTSYDIAKDGDMVAVLTLIKTTYRLGETVLGVVSFNSQRATRHVLKISAYLETHETIPENLLPISAASGGRSSQPNLTRIHAEHHSSYAVQTDRLSFSLDIPSDATPAFDLAAGPDGDLGGLEWKIKLAFLVSSSRATASKSKRREREPRTGSEAATADDARNVLPVPNGGSKDPDNRYFRAAESISPLYPQSKASIDRRSKTLTRSSGDLPDRDSSDEGAEDSSEGEEYVPAQSRGRKSREGSRSAEPALAYEEGVVEVVECEVPIRVLAGNTAFLVRPSVYTV